MMMLTWSFSLVAALLASALAGASCWAVLRIALWSWPELAGRRTPFIAAQVVIACAFAAALLPDSAPWRLGPAVILEMRTPVEPSLKPQASPADSSVLPASTHPVDTGLSREPEQGAVVPVAPSISSRAWLAVPAALSLLYLAGLAWSVLRFGQAQLRWRRLRLASRPLGAEELLAHPAFTAQQVSAMSGKLSVRQSGLALSPMLLGVWRPCLLLPGDLDCFSLPQQQMIVEHELTHWRRRDPAWQALASVLQALLWFNPALRWLQQQLGWAQELGCDRAVLDGKPQQQRKLYAAALLLQLKLQAWAHKQAQDFFPAGNPGMGLAFGGASMAVRVQWMRREGPSRVGICVKLGLGVAFAAIVGASVVLQPALAWREPLSQQQQTALALPASPAGPVVTPQAWRAPLAKVRVTAFFGVRSSLLPNGHRGIDFAATKGTPVLATAAGSVLFVGADERYGNYIVLDHPGGLRSLYAHLDSAAVRTGERVNAGQRIGAVGETGMATGPHLHLAAFRNGQLIDPQQLLAGLDSKATQHALQRRVAAFGH